MHRLFVALSGAGMVAGCVGSPIDRAPLAGDHARDDAKIAAELRGLKPSAPQDCIDSYRLRDAPGEPYGDTLLYRVSASLVYRNDTGGGCYGLARGDTLIDQFNPGIRYASTKLCRGDLLYSRNSREPAPSGSCTRGAWVVYTK